MNGSLSSSTHLMCKTTPSPLGAVNSAGGLFENIFRNNIKLWQKHIAKKFNKYY